VAGGGLDHSVVSETATEQRAMVKERTQRQKKPDIVTYEATVNLGKQLFGW
jgi:hypothetical protein